MEGLSRRERSGKKGKQGERWGKRLRGGERGKMYGRLFVGKKMRRNEGGTVEWGKRMRKRES